jgi:hypothetical protein
VYNQWASKNRFLVGDIVRKINHPFLTSHYSIPNQARTNLRDKKESWKGGRIGSQGRKGTSKNFTGTFRLTRKRKGGEAAAAYNESMKNGRTGDGLRTVASGRRGWIEACEIDGRDLEETGTEG